jgi:hypothetical protein
MVGIIPERDGNFPSDTVPASPVLMWNTTPPFPRDYRGAEHYSGCPSNRDLIMRDDFHVLICLSRAIASARFEYTSDHTRVHGPFFRVYLPTTLSVRLWL